MNETYESKQTLWGMAAGLCCAAALIFYFAQAGNANGGRACRTCRTSAGTAVSTSTNSPNVSPQ